MLAEHFMFPLVGFSGPSPAGDVGARRAHAWAEKAIKWKDLGCKHSEDANDYDDVCDNCKKHDFTSFRIFLHQLL